MVRMGLVAVAVLVAVVVVVQRGADKHVATAGDVKVEARPLTAEDIEAALPGGVKEIDRQPNDEHVKLVSEVQSGPTEEEVAELREKFRGMDYSSLIALFEYHEKECDQCKDQAGAICVEAFLVLQEIMRRPEFHNPPEAAKSAQPLVDPAQIDALNDRLSEISQKIDAIASRPEPVQSAAPSADEIAEKVALKAVFPSADEIAEKVAVKAADKIADKVVEKIRGLLLEIKAADGTVRKEVVKTSSVTGSQPFQLNPGEVITHIDGVPVSQAQAAQAVQYGGWQSNAPVYQTPAYQVRRGAQGYQVMPSCSSCRMVNGQRVCN